MQNRSLMTRCPLTVFISFAIFSPYVMAEEQIQDSTQQTEESSAKSRWQMGLSSRDSDQGQAVDGSAEESASESSFSKKNNWQFGLSGNRPDETKAASADTPEAEPLSSSQSKWQAGLSGHPTDRSEHSAENQSTGLQINRSQWPMGLSSREDVSDDAEEEAAQASANSASQSTSSIKTTATPNLTPARVLGSGAGLISKESE